MVRQVGTPNCSYKSVRFLLKFFVFDYVYQFEIEWDLFVSFGAKVQKSGFINLGWVRVCQKDQRETFQFGFCQPRQGLLEISIPKNINFFVLAVCTLIFTITKTIFDNFQRLLYSSGGDRAIISRIPFRLRWPTSSGTYVSILIHSLFFQSGSLFQVVNLGAGFDALFLRLLNKSSADHLPHPKFKDCHFIEVSQFVLGVAFQGLLLR